jgi:hypothetical protein
MEGNDGVLMDAVTIGTSVRLADIPGNIQNEHFPNNICPELHLYTGLLAGRAIITSTVEGMNFNF